MRWRLLAALTLATLIFATQPVLAGGNATGDTTIGDDGTDSDILVPGSGGEPGKPKQGKGTTGDGNGGSKTPQASACPQFEIQPDTPTFHMRRPNGGYYLMALARCRPGDQYSPIPVRCISECPATDDIQEIPQPPNAADVVKELLSQATPPVPRFAPPVELPDVEAITGLRLYYSVDPTTWAPITPRRVTAPGGWWATTTLTPTTISLTFDGMAASCQGPGGNPKTETGRAKSSAAGCYLIITTIPKGGTALAALTITWVATIRSNVPGVPATGQIDTTSTTTVRVKELQAVIVSNN